MKTLRPYQLEAVKDILDKKKILIADDMGLGKCAESITAKTAIENRIGYNIPTLVVCPASVIQHWEDEIRLWYKKKDATKVTKVQTSTYDEDIKSAENSDFVITGYPTLSYLGNETSKINKFEEMGFQYGIIDEAHNAKNPDSIRSMTVKNLFDNMDYLAILSGTPIPNTVVDIYMLLSLLDKDSFPINVENSRSILTSFYSLFRDDPEFVRRVLNDRMLRRTVDDYLHLNFPELKQKDLEVKLDGEHKDAYLQVYENDNIKPASKLIQLLKASIDPNLINPDLLDDKLASRIGEMESDVYTALDDLVEKIANSDGKVLIFSDLKKGVTEKLKERYNEYGAEVIDGDVSSTSFNDDVSLRENIRRKFQHNPDYKILIATTVMDEGVDLTAATDVVHLTIPYTPAAFEQRIRRAQRIGEIDKDYVNVHVVKPVLDRFTPTITEGIQKLLDDKRRIITYIQKQPFSLTKQDINEIKNGKPGGSKHLVHLIKSPVNSVISHLGQLKGKGFNKISKHYDKYPEEAEHIARLYASYWEGHYGGNTANLYAKIIRLLSEHEDLSKKVDIASGPFSLSRKLKEPVVNVDLNNYMLEGGRLLEEEARIVKGNIAHQGYFHDLNMLKDNEFDLAVTSLALHMSSLKTGSGKNKIREREQAFREQNRILRDNGYSIITLPHTVIQSADLQPFYEGLNQLGFEVLPFSGFFKGPEDSNFKVYLACLRKISEPKVSEVNEELFSWKMDRKLSEEKRHAKKKRKHAIPEDKVIKSEYITNFSLIGKRYSTLEDLVSEVFEK